MAPLRWNWQLPEWPNFGYDESALQDLETEFILQTGKEGGILEFIDDADREKWLVEILTSETLRTAEIEGEILNRESVQSSVKKFLGLDYDQARQPPAEEGMARVMVDIYRHYNLPLTHEYLWKINALMLSHRRDLSDVGRYRRHAEPMQVVSGSIGRHRLHFEAPPSEKVPGEMDAFVSWFNRKHQAGKRMHNPLTLAGITHYYFINIHPFEDGNGRIARALSLKSVAMSLQRPVLLNLSAMINAHKREYYAMLEKHNHSLNITEWLVWYGRLLIRAQTDAVEKLKWIVQKIRFFRQKGHLLNKRQAKVIAKLFEMGPERMSKGLNARTYRRIAHTSESTATRDLQDLVSKAIFYRTGERKGTRYYLLLE